MSKYRWTEAAQIAAHARPDKRAMCPAGPTLMPRSWPVNLLSNAAWRAACGPAPTGWQGPHEAARGQRLGCPTPAAAAPAGHPSPGNERRRHVRQGVGQGPVGRETPVAARIRVGRAADRVTAFAMSEGMTTRLQHSTRAPGRHRRMERPPPRTAAPPAPRRGPGAERKGVRPRAPTAPAAARSPVATTIAVLAADPAANAARATPRPPPDRGRERERPLGRAADPSREANGCAILAPASSRGATRGCGADPGPT